MEADDQVATYGDDQFGLLSDTESNLNWLSICYTIWATNGQQKTSEKSKFKENIDKILSVVI
jgi:hypothetical protein